MLSKQLVNEYMNIFPVLCKSLEFNPIIMSKITQHLCINKVIPKKRLAENLAYFSMVSKGSLKKIEETKLA